MNRRELAKELAQRLRISQRLAEKLVRAFFEELGAAISRGERVELRGFGVFEVRERRTYLGTHPRTREKMLVSPRRTVRFRPSRKILEKLSKATEE